MERRAGLLRAVRFVVRRIQGLMERVVVARQNSPRLVVAAIVGSQGYAAEDFAGVG